MVENWFFLAAAALSIATAAIHVFIGGPEIAKPLLQAEIPTAPKFTNYYCWHLVSITLVAMAIGFLIPALNASQTMSALTWTIISGAFAGWSLALIALKRRPVGELPQWALFTPIFVLGAIGLA